MIADVEGVVRLDRVMVPMRDGVRLATDIYLPSDKAGRLPALLERTPYNRRGTNHADRSAADPVPVSKPEIAARFAREGYAYVLQDCRGRFDSEGTFTKYLNEDLDGVDTIAWILEQPWCNGKVGTLGLSYGAHVQAALAAHDPPGLAAMFLDSGGFSSAFHSGIRQGGALELKQLTWASKHARLSPETEANPDRRAALEAEDIRDWLRKGPWQIGHSPLKAAPEYESFVIDQWRHETFDSFWQSPALWSAGYYDQFADVPTVLMSSWYDPYARSAIENFVGLRATKSSPVQLIMGPWTHGQRSVSHSGDVDFGPDAILDGNLAPDYFALRLAYFDRYLRDAESEDFLSEPVSYFLMGGGSGGKLPNGRLDHGGAWKHATGWPVPEAKDQILYLGESGLVPEIPRAGIVEFVCDPFDPVPTIGGAFASGAPVMEAGAFDQRETEQVFAATKPGRALADRADVLALETAPLSQAIAVVGVPKLLVWISSSALDSDLAVRLIDVHPASQDYPDGYAMNLTHGILRLRFRNGFERAELMDPGMIYPISLEMFPTANLFAAGHRIRIEISGSNFPFFDVNPNTGAPSGEPSDPVVAVNSIHIGRDHPSRLILPVVEVA